MGLHAISAVRLAGFCRKSSCRVRTSCGDTAADAGQMMGLMRLRAKQGDILELQVEGAGENETAKALKTLVGEFL